MSRSLRQLWNVREEFIKFERGWDDSKDIDDHPLIDVENSEPDIEAIESEGRDQKMPSVKAHVRETDNDDVQGRLDAIEDFYVSRTVHSQPLLANPNLRGVLCLTSSQS